MDRLGAKSNSRRTTLISTVVDETHRAAGAPRGVTGNGSGMHEYGLAEGVLATVRQRAARPKVAGIRVRFGVRHAVDSDPWPRRSAS